MWIKLYRYKVYRYLPIAVIIAIIAFLPALAVIHFLVVTLAQVRV